MASADQRLDRRVAAEASCSRAVAHDLVEAGAVQGLVLAVTVGIADIAAGVADAVVAEAAEHAQALIDRQAADQRQRYLASTIVT